LDITDASLATYVAAATKYYYSGAPGYNTSITSSTSGLIFTGNALGITYDETASVGELHVPVSSSTYSVTLQSSSGSIKKLEDSSGYSSTNSGNVVAIAKSSGS